MSLPTWLFVTEETEDGNSKWFSAHKDQSNAVDDDGEAHIVGTYKLVKKNRMRMRAVFDPLPPRRPKKRNS